MTGLSEINTNMHIPRTMEQKQMSMIIVSMIVVALFLGVIYFVYENSGVNPPFTVVESQSMQHSGDSEVGVIDTGDMIYVQTADKHGVTTYVEGAKNRYSSFGDYGDVIIYKRTGNNPVIHRAVLWIEWNGSSWDLSSLEGYDETLWNIDGSHDTVVTSGTLSMTFSSGYRDKTLTLNLGGLNTVSGYLTLGDNNNSFDQSTSISPNTLITEERIKSVASVEIPWLGTLKLLINGNYDNVERNAPSSPLYLAVFFITMILVIFSLMYIYDEMCLMRISYKLE